MTDEDRIRLLERAYDAGDVSVLPRLAAAATRSGRGASAPLAVQLWWLSEAYRDDILAPGICQAFLPEEEGRPSRFYASIQRWPYDNSEKFIVCNAEGPSPGTALRLLLERWHGPFKRGRAEGLDPDCDRCLGSGLGRRAEPCPCSVPPTVVLGG